MTETTSPELQTETVSKFEGLATRLIEHSEAQDPEANLELMRGFLQAFLKDVEGGGVSDSEGDPYSTEIIEAQLTTFVNEMNNPTDREGNAIDPFKRIPRADGLRRAFDVLMKNEATASPLLQAMSELRGLQQIERVEASEEEGAPQGTVEDLGGAALDAVEVDTFDLLSDDDKEDVERYRTAQRINSEDIRNKDFSNAGLSKKRLYEISQELSGKVKEYLKLL